MKDYLKNYFRDWNTFEKLFLLIGLALTVISTILCQGDLIQLIYSSAFLTCAILFSKGKVELYIFNLIGTLCYAWISLRQHYSGEVFINLGLHLPICIYGLFRWLKNTDSASHTVTINTLSNKMIILAFLSQIPLAFVYYAVLKYFNTDQIYLSVMSVVFSTLAIFFQAGISIWSLYCYTLVDTTVASMWLLPILKGDLSLIPVLICPALLVISDLYGIYNWKRLQKQQEKEKNEG